MSDTKNRTRVLWVSSSTMMVAAGVIIKFHRTEKKVLLEWELQDTRRDNELGPLRTWVRIEDVLVQTTMPLTDYLDSNVVNEEE